jgi:hypothetical protein
MEPEDPFASHAPDDADVVRIELVDYADFPAPRNVTWMTNGPGKTVVIDAVVRELRDGGNPRFLVQAKRATERANRPDDTPPTSPIPTSLHKLRPTRIPTRHLTAPLNTIPRLADAPPASTLAATAIAGAVAVAGCALAAGATLRASKATS